jgi:hypothetical protein
VRGTDKVLAKVPGDGTAQPEAAGCGSADSTGTSEAPGCSKIRKKIPPTSARHPKSVTEGKVGGQEEMVLARG